jgi:hypothetical protein
MEVDSVQNCLITKVFEVMSIWRLFHSIHWFDIESIQDVEVLSMCRLDSICHSNLVSIEHIEWYMFEFDCVMMWLNWHSLFVQFQIQSIWKCEDVSVLSEDNNNNEIFLSTFKKKQFKNVWKWVYKWRNQMFISKTILMKCDIKEVHAMMWWEKCD